MNEEEINALCLIIATYAMLNSKMNENLSQLERLKENQLQLSNELEKTRELETKATNEIHSRLGDEFTFNIQEFAENHRDEIIQTMTKLIIDIEKESGQC